MPRKPNPELIDDLAPEADARWFERARPATEVLPTLLGRDVASELLQAKRGRPPSPNPKAHVNIRLDADVLNAFRNMGRGWQTRINAALRDWLSTHS